MQVDPNYKCTNKSVTYTYNEIYVNIDCDVHMHLLHKDMIKNLIKTIYIYIYID